MTTDLLKRIDECLNRRQVRCCEDCPFYRDAECPYTQSTPALKNIDDFLAEHPGPYVIGRELPDAPQWGPAEEVTNGLVDFTVRPIFDAGEAIRSLLSPIYKVKMYLPENKEVPINRMLEGGRRIAIVRPAVDCAHFGRELPAGWKCPAGCPLANACFAAFEKKMQKVMG